MTNYSFPEIVLVPFPFTDEFTSKKRPVLILNTASYHEKTNLVIASMITSSIKTPLWPGDYEIKDWGKAGLLHPSKLRLGKIVTLESLLILKDLGHLADSDIVKIKRLFKDLFSDIL